MEAEYRIYPDGTPKLIIKASNQNDRDFLALFRTHVTKAGSDIVLISASGTMDTEGLTSIALGAVTPIESEDNK